MGDRKCEMKRIGSDTESILRPDGPRDTGGREKACPHGFSRNSSKGASERLICH